jgi:hypothetical protein
MVSTDEVLSSMHSSSTRNRFFEEHEKDEGGKANSLSNSYDIPTNIHTNKYKQMAVYALYVLHHLNKQTHTQRLHEAGQLLALHTSAKGSESYCYN